MAVDYRDFNGTKPQGAAGGAWWAAKKTDVHEAVTAALDSIRNRQKYRSEANLTHARLYGGMQTLGFTPRGYTRELATASQTPNAKRRNRSRIQLNLIKSMADTVVAKVGKSKPRATFLTSGGKFSEQQRAKSLNRLSQGQFHEAGVYQRSPLMLRDAAVLGTGVLKVFIQCWRVCVERVLVEEIYVDDAEAIYGEPRSLFQTKAIAREVLRGTPDYAAGKKQTAIDDGRKPVEGSPIPLGGSSEGDMVEVIEAWHLPSDDGANGRHVICTSAGVLLDEGWDWDCFPFVVERYAHRLLGWYGEGIPERHLGRQESINRTLIRIDDILHLMASPRYLVPDGGNIAVEQIRNAVGDIVKYRGAVPPQIQVPPQMTGELMMFLQSLVRDGYELEGISQMSAGARKPAGLNSGAAIREFSDVEAERFVILGQEHEESHLQLAKLMLRMGAKLHCMLKEAREAGEDVPEKYEVRHVEKSGYQNVEWDEVFPEGDVDWDSFVMQVFPTSSLPTTPAARKEAVEEMWQSGWINQEEARRLLDFPDLDASNNVAFAAWEDIEQTMEDMVEHGKYRTPEPFQNLQMGIPRAQSAYLRARRLGCPEERLEMLRRWMAEAERTLTAAKTLPTPSAPAMPAGPQMPPVDPMAAQMPPQAVPPMPVA